MQTLPGSWNSRTCTDTDNCTERVTFSTDLCVLHIAYCSISRRRKCCKGFLCHPQQPKSHAVGACSILCRAVELSSCRAVETEQLHCRYPVMHHLFFHPSSRTSTEYTTTHMQSCVATLRQPCLHAWLARWVYRKFATITR